MQNLVRTASMLLLLFASAAQADEIYKWVDKEGRTHYSSRKEEAEGAATTTMRPNPAPPVGSGPPPAARAANEEIIRRGSPLTDTAAATTAQPSASSAAVAQKPAGRIDTPETDAGKCGLARDVLAGNAEHRSGAPLDAYDRQIAENDVRTFCRR
jgi:hypothetical protein